MRERLRWAVIVCLGLSGGWAYAQDAPSPPPGAAPAPPGDQYVTRAEYEKLLQEMQKMRSDMAEVRLRAAEAGTTFDGGPSAHRPGATSEAEADQAIDELQKAMKDMSRRVDAVSPGFRNFLIAGDAALGFTDLKGAPSSFGATFSPLFLWRVSPDLIFEGALDISVNNATADGSGQTEVNLTIADATYLLNDYIAIGGGLFVTPFGRYHPHWDAPWINKFPDDPLPFGDGGIAPGSTLGVFANGALPFDVCQHSMKATYAVYAGNGPRLLTNNADMTGQLAFDNYDDIRDSKAVGGRFGFLPVPELEVGYSIQYAGVNPPGFPSTNALLQAVDFQYKRDFDCIAGTIDAHFEWVWSQVEEVPYADAGLAAFSNNREGGYMSLGYRPSKINNRIIKNLEFLVRYDWLNTPLGSPGGNHRNRWTVGVDYWILPNAVLKAAYEFDDEKVGPDQNGFLLQLGIGF